MDNGRTDSRDRKIWQFDWADCPQASEYHLKVQGKGTSKPLIDATGLFNSEYEHNKRSYIADRYRLNWSWKVRAKIAGSWGPWSAPRQFEVEPINTDPPAIAE